jgi:hypothetical protein
VVLMDFYPSVDDPEKEEAGEIKQETTNQIF